MRAAHAPERLHHDGLAHGAGGRGVKHDLKAVGRALRELLVALAVRHHVRDAVLDHLVVGVAVFRLEVVRVHVGHRANDLDAVRHVHRERHDLVLGQVSELHGVLSQREAVEGLEGHARLVVRVQRAGPEQRASSEQSEHKDRLGGN